MIKGIEITGISVFPVRNAVGKLRAMVRLQLNGALQLTNIRLYEGSKGLCVAYPIEASSKSEEFRVVFYPIDQEFREYVQKTVIAEYHKVVDDVETT